MKNKVLVLLLAALMVISMFAGCSKKADTKNLKNRTFPAINSRQRIPQSSKFAALLHELVNSEEGREKKNI